MKTAFISLAILISVAVEKCNNNKKGKLPACIQQKIEAIKKEPRWNPPAEVYEYSYNGKSVFYFTSDCCDNFNAVIDENCNYICAPDGGITGKGDGKCKDFNTNAKKIKLIWKDDRTSP